MEWILILLAFGYFAVLLRRFPSLFSPRCPLCGGRLTNEITETPVHLAGRWYAGWRRFSCVQCLYHHRRPILLRTIEEKQEQSWEPHHAH